MKIRIILLTGILFTGIVFAQDQPFIYNDHNKRDPFWRLVTAGGAVLNYETNLVLTEMTLEGIIFDPQGKSLAIINGMILKPNDKIGLYVISRIEEKKVILFKDETSFVLELNKEE